MYHTQAAYMLLVPVVCTCSRSSNASYFTYGVGQLGAMRVSLFSFVMMTPMMQASSRRNTFSTITKVMRGCKADHRYPWGRRERWPRQ